MKIHVDKRIILMWILNKYDTGFVDRIHLAEDNNQWRALVNTVRGQRVL
jgi:hypothetical protein